MVAQALQRAVVIHGNALDTEILEEANAAAADTVIAVSNDDEVNILTSLLAKRYGCRRAVTLINKVSYAPLIATRSEEHTSELQSLMPTSYAVFCLKQKT